MAEQMVSVGLDVGTTTTQLIVSRLQVENRSSAFSVPEMAVTGREVVYRSAVVFTPLLHGELVDGEKIRQWVTREYEKAGICRENVDTGAVIITGETSRKENAAAVLEALSGFAGEFVVAAAGPELESVLAAKGAGVTEYSADTGKRVLHMDIGGGTSNLALVENGRIVKTGCMNVGGRLIRLDPEGTVTYVSPVLAQLCPLRPGIRAEAKELENVALQLVQALEMAAGLRPPTQLLERLWTREAGKPWLPPAEGCTLSFSGGVADCIEQAVPHGTFGDIGPILGKMIRQSRLCAGEYRMGAQTIRATVIGAGCHSMQLSGSTVYHQNVVFPLKNLPVVSTLEELSRLDGPGVLALRPGQEGSYRKIQELADTLSGQWPRQPVYLAAREDLAKALGHALALRLGTQRPILCMDRLQLREGDYLDVAAPVGPALPVVVKTLIFGG